MRSDRSRRLGVLFPLIVAACGGASTPEEAPTKSPPNTDFPLLLACTKSFSGAHWDVVTPSPEWDGFEVRRTARFSPDGGTSTKRALAPLCTKATDPAACASAAASAGSDVAGWDAEGPSNGSNRSIDPELVVATKGDEVRVIGTLDELGAAIAPIETAAEAAALAKLRHGYRPHCLAEDTEVTAARAVGDAFELVLRRHVGCAGHQDEAVIRVERDGTSSILSERVVANAQPDGPVCGRRPEGLAPLVNARNEAAGGVAGLLARMAWLEAASVPAFASLARDLARHGAPRELVERAIAARSDEIMHARLTREAARRHGASPENPRVARAKPRSLFELALENAVEGCVREAFGALVATHQAKHATDPALRAMFASIAVDETEHAALSLDLAEWIMPRLTEAQRAAIARAREDAFAELEAAVVEDPSAEEVALAGMPTPATARRLLEALRALDPDALA